MLSRFFHAILSALGLGGRSYGRPVRSFPGDLTPAPIKQKPATPAERD
jgi:hypothetical protein